MGRTSANVLKRHYRVMHRTPAAYVEPADAAAFATFLATFTELGYCRDKTIKLTLEPSEVETFDDGTNKQMGWNGHLEGTLLQSEDADYTAYEAIENIDQDIFLYSEVTGMCIFLGNALLVFLEAISSGDVESVPFTYDKTDMATKATFRSRFEEPLV
jgi:hypothetical protein